MLKPPKHLAIIMDGNGRWAAVRGKARFMGHLRGARVAKQMILDCASMGVEYLTLYAFSSENWNRPPAEVKFLMDLLFRYLSREAENLAKKNIRFSVIGNEEQLPQVTIDALSRARELTKNCTGMQVVFAISYGSQQEITDAVRAIAQDVSAGRLRPGEIQIATVERYLSTHPIPPPDLVIRTSGEKRISNFLLWQIAYSELVFTDRLWPDFTKADLDEAILEFNRRQRRFGRVSSENVVTSH